MAPVRRLAQWLALAFAMLAFAGAAQAQSFPKLTGRVVDAANLLSPEQEAQLTQLSEQVEQASSRQFVIATIPDLEGHDIADYGYQLGRTWGIGPKEANNGILLIVAPNERKVRIEVGYGLEPVMTDALSSVIINSVILPKFRKHDMAGGIITGANEIAEQMKLPLEAAEQKAKARVDAAKKHGSRKDDVGVLVGGFWGIVMLAFFFAAIFGNRRRGRRYRGGVAPILLWSMLDAAARSGRHDGGGGWGGGSGGGGGGWGGGGGFSGGGGSFGGGGASGSW